MPRPGPHSNAAAPWLPALLLATCCCYACTRCMHAICLLREQCARMRWQPRLSHRAGLGLAQQTKRPCSAVHHNAWRRLRLLQLRKVPHDALCQLHVRLRARMRRLRHHDWSALVRLLTHRYMQWDLRGATVAFGQPCESQGTINYWPARAACCAQHTPPQAHPGRTAAPCDAHRQSQRCAPCAHTRCTHGSSCSPQAPAAALQAAGIAEHRCGHGHAGCRAGSAVVGCLVMG